MNRLSDVRDNAFGVSMVRLVAVAVVGMTGFVSGTRLIAAESAEVPAVLTQTLATPVLCQPMPWWAAFETLVMNKVGRYAWQQYDGPQVMKTCYEETRRAVGSAVRYGKSTAETVAGAALQTLKRARSDLNAACRWLRE